MIRPQGVLIGDDYPHWREVEKAFDNFFGDRGEVPLEVDPPKCRIFK